MWTPKRVLILLGTLPLFVLGFVIYVYFLGNIDGLPPLPADYEPGKEVELLPISDEGVGTPWTIPEKLALAFGADCPELRREVKLNLNSKGFVLSAQEMEIVADGRVKLWPFSAAIFPKNRVDTKSPEINTVQSDVAFLTLDKPVTSLTELNNRKIVGVELKSEKEIVLINNRSTPEKHDDLVVVITQDSLFYDEIRHLVWSDGYVKLQDNQSQPHPTLITAKGLEMQLAKEATPAARRPAKKGENVQGVETLLLKATVEMHFYVENNSGFLGADDGKNSRAAAEKKAVVVADKKTAPVKKDERSHLVIKTPGKFHYDLTKELASFDSPDPAVGAQEVTVWREHKSPEGIKIDQMSCQHLELQFRRKPRDPAAPRATGGDKEIETALATARPGATVALAMDSEQLAAWGAELHYRCPTATTGPQTTLKGAPMNAVKEGHKIQCQELHLIGADKKGMGQQAFAKGPGQLDLYDKNNAKKEYPFHAFWKDSLIFVKDRDGEKVFDLITLTGDAVFLDEEHKQELQGQRLQVWLDSAAKTVAAADAPKELGRQRPHKIDAFERVAMRSPEMIIDRCHHLIVRFQNQDTLDARLPEALPAALPPAAPSPETPSVTPPPPLGAPKDGKAALAPPTTETPPGAINPKNRNPMHLEANEIVAYVANKGVKKELLEVVCEGVVHVKQNGETPKDKGVEITGEMLNLIRHAEGDVLYVFGDLRKAGYLQLGELILQGPKVTINQRTNMAEVEGPGLMEMPSNKTLDGGKSSKPDTRLTIHWNRDMIFNGKDADFNGGVQAYQDNGALKCDTLQVTLDRTVSLKEGQKSGQQATVEKLVCHRKVWAQDETRDPAGKLGQYNRLIAAELAVDNIGGPSIAHGPGGRVIHLGLGTLDDQAAPAKKGAAPPAKAKDLVMKRTIVDFEGRMFSNHKAEARNAKFYDNVEVHHDVTDNPDAKVNPARPGPGGFHMRADTLSVYTRTEGGKSSQEMEAKGKVDFNTDEFYGRATTVKYNQAEEVIIFEGAPGLPAALYKQRGPGIEPQEIKGNKIRYNRKTGEFQLEGGKILRWSKREAPRGERELCAAGAVILPCTAAPVWQGSGVRLSWFRSA
ncbi:MAG: LptA/OstA family protein [Gemmataceae bacterium]